MSWARLKLAALCLALAATPTRAETTRIIVAFSAGGPIDLVARTIVEPMQKALGHTVVVENRPGGNTLIGAQAVAQAPPDGSVVMLSSVSTLVLNPLLYAKLPYDADRDLASIAVVATVPPVLVVHPSNPAKDAAEFAANGKTSGQPIAIGSSGIGGTTHISLELFQQAAGVELLHVPYKGAADVVNDVIGNHVSGFFGDLPGVISNIRAGKLKPLGVLSPARNPLLPEVKTLAEQGIKGTESENWYGMVAPGKTPPEIIAKLNAAVLTALRDDAVKARLADVGATIVGSTPAELDARRKSETAFYGALIKTRGIKLE
ncbi:MAG: tripartite tricarboxylate transporter substrate binding protein [Proteobacteria bacterium]|nr:tripartite tricarboxylate transporter substrate binding protein [Pseudomonadota bacterium]